VALLLPAEKPSLTLRSAKSGSMSRSVIACLTSLTQVRSFGRLAATAVAAERRKFAVDTPGDLDRVLHGEEQTRAGALVDGHGEDVLLDPVTGRPASPCRG
jgi:hypothetical protein